jgi:hypothetical protein
LARAKHNDLREGHQWVDDATEAVDITPPLEADDERAKTIQKVMDENFDGTEASIKDYLPSTCSMSIYKETDAAAVATLERSHAATDNWYHEGIKQYDFDTD